MRTSYSWKIGIQAVFRDSVTAVALSVAMAFPITGAFAEDDYDPLPGVWTREGPGSQPVLRFGKLVDSPRRAPAGDFGWDMPPLSRFTPKTIQFGQGKYVPCHENAADLCLETPTLRCLVQLNYVGARSSDSFRLRLSTVGGSSITCSELTGNYYVTGR